ncbi:MAG TPA: PP2C family serine/threonine-protein phosphatase [Candidatus Sulfotelmatobacter sp.]|jgi:serine/threonine protein phosphatase PrpC|nr:PP2C family serine/threonine-protein phosphatase [Candidatus Sulfotelmatobacter sp.]
MFATAKQIQAGGKELQDRAEILWVGSNLVLVVADGAGGMSGGAEAAQFLVDGIKQRIASIDMNADGLNELLTSLDREMADGGTFGETTGVVVVLSGGGIFGASIGDSGAFVFSKNGVENLTANQTRKPFLGSGRAVSIPFIRESLNGTLLVATDGLLKYTSLEKIASTILAADFDATAGRLVDLVRYQSRALPDDISILLARKI